MNMIISRKMLKKDVSAKHVLRINLYVKLPKFLWHTNTSVCDQC